MTFAKGRSSALLRRVPRGSVVRVAIVSIFVATSAMTVAAVSSGVAAASQTAWSAPLNVDTSNSIFGVSCASPLFCAAVDGNGGALTYNGSSWSPRNLITEGGWFSVSCPSSTFCVATGFEGTEDTWNGSSWSGPNPVGSDSSNLLSVSCTSSHFCVAADGSGGVDTWNGTTWTGPNLIAAETSLNSVSCTSPTFCVAVNSSGNAYTYDGINWTSNDIDVSNVLNSVSCSSSAFCVAVDNVGNAVVYNGSSWSTTDIDGVNRIVSDSCASSTFCVATDNIGNALTYNGSSWSTASIDANALNSVDCPTSSFCVAVDDAGNAITYGWVSASYACNVSGLTTTDPIVLSESPSPPPSITAPGTYSTTLSAQVTIPATQINAAIADGATSITIDSQSVEVDGLTGGSPSSSVSPNSLVTSATNLPITFTPQSDTPFTYATTYNPETWQTQNVPGTVDFTPGPINSTFTYLISGTPSPVSAACTPPAGVASLDSTVVNASSATPSFQLPASVPALQSQVTSPLDDGWAIKVTNTSTVPVDGLSARVGVHGGGVTINYDFAGMANTGTTCASSGAGIATCNVGILAAGASVTINALVQTTGLPRGTTISGTVDVTSTNAATQSATLGALSVVVVQNGAVAVAVPTVEVKSTTAMLSGSVPGKVKLTLPRNVPVMGPFGSLQATGGMPFAGPVKGPPVSVTLQPLAGSQDPELCPPVSGGCEGDIVRAQGNFAAYTSRANPISIVVKIFYGSAPPAGSIYFQGAANDTPVLLSSCVKTGGLYNTPCVFGAEKILGTPGNQSTADTVFFTGGDPLVGRR